MKNLTKKSKFLSLILRHNPGAIGIEMDRGGWVKVSDLCRLMPISGEDLEEIVRTDEKGRYSYNHDGILIRANQGHSIEVDVGLQEKDPPEYLWHGTGKKYLDSIWKEGIIPRGRLYVHLSRDKETAIKVGKRHGKPALLRVKSGEMNKLGHKFWLSKNNVWLTKHVENQFLETWGIDW